MNYSTPKHIGNHNKNKMLTILRDRGAASRVELSRLLGISATAVTRNTSKLLELGIIREGGAEHSAMGRKPVRLELCGDFCYVIGADVVGGTIKVAVANLMGEIVRYYEEPLARSRGARTVFSQLLAALGKVIRTPGIPRDRIWVAVVGTPGVFDEQQGRSRFTFFLDGWEDINLRQAISEELGIETLVDNDVNLDVIGESWMGGGKDHDDILYVKLGQGLASRIVLQDKLVRGKHNMAGELGYMLPGKFTPDGVNYEKMLTNDALSRRYRQENGEAAGRAHTVSDLIALRDRGDPAAKTVIGELLDYFSVVLLNGAALLDPQLIILGGDACRFSPEDIALLKERVEHHLPLEQTIIPSRLDKKACVYGAVKVGLDRVEERIIDMW